MSERVCQFFIRGRCQRENCEFKHVKPVAASGSSDMPVGETQGNTVPVVARKVLTNEYYFIV